MFLIFFPAHFERFPKTLFLGVTWNASITQNSNLRAGLFWGILSANDHPHILETLSIFISPWHSSFQSVASKDIDIYL
jgi:hypothetical protein